MKRPISSLLVFVILLVLFCIGPPAVADDPPQGHPGLILVETDMLDLDRSRVSTGILEDVGFTPVDFAPFNGYSLVDSNYVNYQVFDGLLEGLANSRVGGSLIPSTITTQMTSAFQTGTNPVGIIAYKYSRVVDRAVSDNLVMVDVNGTIQDKYTAGGEWVNPYEEKYLIACSPYMNIVGTQVTYSFNSSQIISNLSNVSSIQFHPGDNGGYRTIGTGTTNISVTYPSQSTTTNLILRITLTDQTVLYSHSRVAIVSPSAQTIYSSTSIDDVHYFTSLSTYEGYQPSARVSVKLGIGSSSLTRPLIFAEGFDPFSDPYKVLDIYGTPADTTGVGMNRIGSLYNTIHAANLDSLDIVYIDWLDSRAPIQANADVLRQVILWVNNEKSGNEKNILVGESMGGLIARYTLRTMEIANEVHNVKTYVSIDSPHYGVNVPLGALYAAQHIYNIANLEEDSLIDNLCDFILQNRTGLSSASARSYLNELLDLRSAPSVKQMLIYYVNSNYELETTAYSQFQSTLNSIGFPQGDSGFGIKNLSVSNGGVNNYISCLDYLLNRSLTVGTGILTDMIFFPITILLDFDYFGFLGLLPGLTSISSYTRIFPFRTPGQSIFEASAVYTKKYGYMPDQNHYYYNYQYNAPNYLRISDDDAGSFIDWKTKITKPIDLANTYLGEISFESFLTPRIMFVPSVSSLHYKYSLSSLSSDERKANFITAGIDMNDIPFNGYRFHKDTSSYHTEALYYDYQWIDRMQDLSITPAPDTLNTTYCFTISDADPSMPPYSVEWSISDTYVATIDSSTGVLTPNLGGTAQVYADVSYLNGHLRLTRTVYIPEEEFPGFPNYTLKADAGIILLDNTFSGDYTITATQLSAVDARFKPYMKCHWGLKTSNTAPIVWTEDSYNVLGIKLYYFCNIPELSSERRVYFYVSFRNQLVSPTYSVFCLYPPIHFQLDGEGNLYAEGIDDPITQLKSDISEIQYVFHCLDKEFTFGHWPSSAEFCLELLTSECFVNMVKEMRPWGEKTQLLIPYSWNTSEDETMQFDLLTIQFDETL